MRRALLFTVLILQMLDIQAAVLFNEKRELVDEMLKLNGTPKLVDLMTASLSGQIIAVLSKQKGTVDKMLAGLVQSEVKNSMYENFVLNNKFNEIFYTLYDDYFTTEELHEMVDYYHSAAGKKELKYMSVISNKSMQEAKAQAKVVAGEVYKRLLEKIDTAAKTQKTGKKGALNRDTNNLNNEQPSSKDEDVVDSHYN